MYQIETLHLTNHETETLKERKMKIEIDMNPAILIKLEEIATKNEMTNVEVIKELIDNEYDASDGADRATLRYI